MQRAVAIVACSLLAPAGAQAARAADPAVAPRQELATLLDRHEVRDRPDLRGRRVASADARRPITGVRTVLPVLAQTTDDGGRAWLRIRLPGRALVGRSPPASGWIRAASTRRSSTTRHIVVDLGARRVIVYRAGRRLRSYKAIVGKRSTPTPRGEFFVEENVALPANRSGAPFALATSARSSVLQEFDGGPGQIALHGLEHLGGELGSAVSHGCIRLARAAITWLAARIEPGVPVTIV